MKRKNRIIIIFSLQMLLLYFIDGLHKINRFPSEYVFELLYLYTILGMAICLISEDKKIKFEKKYENN